MPPFACTAANDCPYVCTRMQAAVKKGGWEIDAREVLADTRSIACIV